MSNFSIPPPCRKILAYLFKSLKIHFWYFDVHFTKSPLGKYNIPLNKSPWIVFFWSNPLSSFYYSPLSLAYIYESIIVTCREMELDNVRSIISTIFWQLIKPEALWPLIPYPSLTVTPRRIQLTWDGGYRITY